IVCPAALYVVGFGVFVMVHAGAALKVTVACAVAFGSTPFAAVPVAVAVLTILFGTSVAFVAYAAVHVMLAPTARVVAGQFTVAMSESATPIALIATLPVLVSR